MIHRCSGMGAFSFFFSSLIFFSLSLSMRFRGLWLHSCFFPNKIWTRKENHMGRKKEEGGGGVGKEKGTESRIGERKEADCAVVGIGGIWWWRACICQHGRLRRIRRIFPWRQRKQERKKFSYGLALDCAMRDACVCVCVCMAWLSKETKAPFWRAPRRS